MKYVVFVSVGKDSYMVSVDACSLYAAEHKFLDMGICSKYGYGVNGVTAFEDGAKDDYFISLVFTSQTVSADQLKEIIDAENYRIQSKDRAEKRITEIEQAIELLQKEKEECERVLNA